MANRERGERAITIGGRTYTLVMDANAMAWLEAHFSTFERPVVYPEVLALMERGSVTAIRAYLCAACQRHHPGMTIEAAGDLIQAAGGVGAFTRVIQAAASATMPDPADIEALGPPNGTDPQKARVTSRADGTGGRSISKPVAVA